MTALQPAIERLHAEQRARLADRPSPRETLVEAVASTALLAVCVLLSLIEPAQSPLITWTSVGLVALYAVVGLVRFDVGSGTASPVQLVFVPMWFAVAPAEVPLLVIAGELLRSVLGTLVDGRRVHLAHVPMAIADAWYSVGPAIVLMALGGTDPQLSSWPIYTLALGAQVAVDAVVTTTRGWAAAGVPPSRQWGPAGWVALVDLALTPIGVFVALAMLGEPWAAIGLLPLVGLLYLFAREREERIRYALELSGAYRGTARLMGDVLEADDAYTGGEHTQGVVALALAIGSCLRLNDRQMRDLEFGALLHDVGKLRVPNAIINKPGKLTADEWVLIRRHPGYGQEMLDRVGGVLSDAGAIVRAHHERWDGEGYPDHLIGEQIPLLARIITVCDSFSAMTTDRPYSAGMPQEAALAEVRRCSGSQFDPTVVEALDSALRNATVDSLRERREGAAPASLPTR